MQHNIPEEASLSYYPAAHYLTKKWKAESVLTDRDVYALGKAARKAVDSGVLDKQLAEYMLPMAMVEDRSGNFGIRKDMALYPHAKTVDAFKRMGLSVDTHKSDTRGLGDIFALPAPLRITGEGRDKYLTLHNARSTEANASIMAGLLAHKASLNRKGTVEDHIKRYNGVGTAMELEKGEWIPANTDIYLKKVKDAKAMLAHPLNKGMLSIYNKAYNGE